MCVYIYMCVEDIQKGGVRMCGQEDEEIQLKNNMILRHVVLYIWIEKMVWE